MPRPTRSQGRPGTPVIPCDWGPSHQPVVAKTLTGTCTIRRPGGTKDTFNQTTGTWSVTPYAPHYTGGCRIQILSVEERNELFADEPLTTVGYRVVVDLDASSETHVADLVEVTGIGGSGDPTLTGRSLTVRSFSRGTLAWERDLVCVEALPQT